MITTQATDKSGQPIGPTAAKIDLMAGKDQPPTASVVLERYVAPTDTLIVAAGDYTAYVSHGPEYEMDHHDVTIPAGGQVSLQASVAHVVDTTGWVSADLHIHSTKSADAEAARRLRVLNSVAENVEILISTDHDIVTDYAPFVKALGLDSMVRTVTGIEVSPVYGHMNGFPVPIEAPVEAYWRIVWYKYKDTGEFDRVLDPAEIARNLRGIGAKYVQINHPRNGSGGFDYLGLDPTTGQTAKEWPDIDGFEILNGKSGGDVDKGFADFVGLLKANRRVTATGVSDAHSPYAPLGYARTMVRVGEDDATKLDLDKLWAGLHQGQVVALSGPMVTLEAHQGANAALIGDTLSASGPVQLKLHIEAPSWMDVSSYTVYENGNVMTQASLTDADRSPANPAVRLDRTITATVSTDSFYFVDVQGSPGSPNAPVMDSTARSITNPVFIDANGDGFHFMR
jgi:hypothetical protein